MSDQRQVAQFSRELITRIKKVGSDQQVLDQVFHKFIEMIGGPTSLAGKLKDDFDKVRGENLSVKEQQLYERKDSVIVKYWQMILSLQEKLDDRNNVDASGLTDEDLRATLAALAAQMMTEDSDFRSQVMGNISMQRPPIDVEVQPAPLPFPDDEPSWEDENDE